MRWLDRVALAAALLLSGCQGDGSENGTSARLQRYLEQLERMTYHPAGTVERDPAELDYDRVPSDEGGSRSVDRPLFIDRFEVTNGAFAEFLAATGYQPEGPGFLAHWESPPGEWRCPPGREEYPVVWISYRDAVAYADWRNQRLPTQTEWQLAAKGDSGRPYPWGRSTDVSNRANVLSTGILRPSPVGFFESGRSERGCYDLVGNVWEWSATQGPRPGTRVQLGGAFNTPAGSVAKTSIHRFFQDNDLWLQGEANRSSDRGFRCCVDAEQFLEGLLQALAEAPESEAGLALRAALRRLPAEARALAVSIAEDLPDAAWAAELASL